MKDNKLIAEFMGFTLERNLGWYDDKEMLSNTYNQSGANCFNEKDLLFSESWDWLMPVIEEIDHTSYEPIESIEDGIATRSLEMTHKAVVEYIKTYER